MSSELLVQIVEDDPIIGLDLQKTLQGFGYRTSGPLPTAAEAIESAKNNPPDLILMDINLKGRMDGIEAASEISKTRSIPVIFLTGDSDEKTLQRAMLTIPHGYLIKPFDPFELHSTIEVAMRQFAQDADQPPPPSEDIVFTGTVTGEGDEKFGLLKNIPLLQSLPPATLASLAERAILRQHDAAETLVSPDKDGEGGFIPVSGRVSITRVSGAGKELVVALVGPGDVFGLFYGLRPFRGSSWAQTQVASRVLWFPSQVLQFHLQQSTEFLFMLTEELSRRLVHAHRLSTSLAHSRVEDRITMMLFTLLEEFGRETGNADSGRVFITRRELADLVGTTPETAIRVTKALERDGLLDLTKPGIIKVPSISTLREWAEGKNA